MGSTRLRADYGRRGGTENRAAGTVIVMTRLGNHMDQQKGLKNRQAEIWLKWEPSGREPGLEGGGRREGIPGRVKERGIRVGAEDVKSLTSLRRRSLSLCLAGS